ncbi:MAG: ATP-binding protein [Micromonosporaceae bacterium]
MSRPAAAAAATVWTLRSELRLGAFPSAVSCARLHARQVVWEWALRDISETVELVVSELATNAIKASVGADGRLPGYDAKERSRWIGLRLSSDQARVLVEVWDSNPLAPDPRNAHADDEAGRGLTLVAAVCERWDWYPVNDGQGGKVVWGMVKA